MIRLEHPFSFPYTAEQLSAGLRIGVSEGQVSQWSGPLKNQLMRYELPSENASSGKGRWNLGVNGFYSLESEGGGDRRGLYRAEIYGCYQTPRFVLWNRTVTDQHFRGDPLYFGDKGEWISGRVEDAYALILAKPFRFFAGRVSRNFGMPDQYSLLLSDYPYSYDHFGFDYLSKRLNFSYYFTRLNDMNGFDSQQEFPETVRAKRYISVQHATLNFGDKAKLGLFQGCVYGGENRDFEAAFLNPMGLFYVSQRNLRLQMNGLWGGEVFIRPVPGVSAFAQWLVDDVIVNNHPGQDDRARHPDRMGVLARLVWCDGPIRESMLGLTYTRLGNWTYMSYRTWENYQYYGKSLGYPFNSYETAGLDFTVLKLHPWIFAATGSYSRHGNQDVTAAFADVRAPFPIRPVEDLTQLKLKVKYMPSPKYYIQLNIIAGRFKNRDNAEREQSNSLQFLLECHRNFNVTFDY